MSGKRVTVVLGYRDRELDRVKRSLASLNLQTCDDFCVNFVDYGSRPLNARAVRELTDSFTFCRHLYSDTRGHPWNRSRALNIGIRHSRTEFVLTTDVDMIFAPNFVETLLLKQDGNTIVCCAPRWLPKSFTDWDDLTTSGDDFPLGDQSQLGGCQCVPRDILTQIHGFDESFEYWGMEDTDIQWRLTKLGLRQTWIDDKTSIFHQWHPKERGGVPRSHNQRWVQDYLSQVNDTLTRNATDWGQIKQRDERPLLKLLSKVQSESTPKVIAPITGTPRLLLTDRHSTPQYSDDIMNNFQVITLSTPSTTYVLKNEIEKEHAIERVFVDTLERSANHKHKSPQAIAIDVSSSWRLSKHVLFSLMNMLAPGGILTISNLRQPRLPILWKCMRSMLTPVLRLICPRLWRISTQAQSVCKKMLTSLQAQNELQDSVHLARIEATGIEDYVLDFPSWRGTAVFLKQRSDVRR